MTYNATVYQTWRDSKGRGTFVAEAVEINGKLQMLRSNAVTFTGYENRVLFNDIPEYNAIKGDAAYDVYFRRTHPNSNFEIVLDGCDGYKNALGGLNLPPAYKP